MKAYMAYQIVLAFAFLRDEFGQRSLGTNTYDESTISGYQ